MIDQAILLADRLCPCVGSQCNCTAKISTRMIARKNEGIAIPMNEKIVTRWSQIEYCLIAEMIPIGMARRSERISEIPNSSRVRGRRCMITVLTSLRWMIESPKLPPRPVTRQPRVLLIPRQIEPHLLTEALDLGLVGALIDRELRGDRRGRR